MRPPFPGHLGVNKFWHKILDHFYWLRLRKVRHNTASRFTPVRWLRNQIRSFQKYRYSHYQPFKSNSAKQPLLIVQCHYLRRGLDTSIWWPSCVHPVDFLIRALEKYQSKGHSQNFIKLFTQVGLPSSIQYDQGSNVVWHISTRHARAWSHTVYVDRMSLWKSKSFRKMAPSTEEHDEDLLFRNRGRLGRGYPSTTVCCRWVSTGVSRIRSIRARIWTHCERTS